MFASFLVWLCQQLALHCCSRVPRPRRPAAPLPTAALCSPQPQFAPARVAAWQGRGRAAARGPTTPR
eukprot:6783035-Lingulodinium_polyedra.AAC.1